jgi:hypothetical protein
VNRLPLVVVGLVGLVAGGAIGMAAFGEDTKTVTSPPQVVTNTQTRTKTVGKGRARTVTRTQTVTTQAPSSGAPGEPGAGGGSTNVKGARTFTGKDFKQFGTLKVKKTSTVEWTNTGRVFSVISQTQLHVSTTKKKGSFRLFAGSYENFRIAALGRWKVTITPR